MNIFRPILSALFLFFITNVYSFGVVVDNENYENLHLYNSSYNAEVYNQILSSYLTSSFVNNTSDSVFVKFIFPLEEYGTITNLSYEYKGISYQANLVDEEQDSVSDNGSFLTLELIDYHGDNPLLFDCPLYIGAGDSISFSIDYVDLLNYESNITSLKLPFTSVSSTNIEEVSVNINLISEREIVDVQSNSSHNPFINYSSFEGQISFSDSNYSPNDDFEITYQLLAEDLGIQLISTYIEHDTLSLCDSIGGGYAAFIVEPNPPESQIIEKDFVMVIDVSGSMGGDKIQQAKDAANFIVDNLNSNDNFGIVIFSSDAETFSTGIVENNITNRNSAHAFINSLSTGGGTNITSSFVEAIPMFQNSADERAKMILFFTDGQQGGEQAILDEILNLRLNYSPDLSIFSFGIGQGANQSLLSQIASQNNGLAEFVGSDELYTTLSNFYTIIQNPVLLNIVVEFSPDIVFELYPAILPNLYKGQQLLLAGRYDIADTTIISLSGSSFGENQLFDYNVMLSDTTNTSLSFLPKLWSNLKIKNLMYDFYEIQEGVIQDEIEEEITDLSLCYGILSPFTSFQGEVAGNIYEIVSVIEQDIVDNIQFIYPNPVDDYFSLINFDTEVESIIIYSIDGKIVYKGTLGNEENIACDFLNSGIYFVEIVVNNKIYVNKLIKR